MLNLSSAVLLIVDTTLQINFKVPPRLARHTRPLFSSFYFIIPFSSSNFLLKSHSYRLVRSANEDPAFNNRL